MGGKAFKHLKMQRLSRHQYKDIEQSILNKLSPLVTHIGIPIYFKSKESFGDLDIVYHCDRSDIFINEVLKILDTPHIVKNGSVSSIAIAYDNFDNDKSFFQIDLIYASRENFNCMMFYLSYHDLGALIGMVCKAYGLGFGGEVGLFHNVLINNDVTKWCGRITISMDPVYICEILGLDSNVANACYSECSQIRLHSYDEVFKYIAKSPLFCPSLWKINMNHDEKVRAKKRPMYVEFITNFLPLCPLNQNKISSETLLLRVLDSQMMEKRNNMIYEYHRRQDAKAKFNGKIVESLINISGKELGNFIQELLKSNPLLKSIDYLLETDQSIINELITKKFVNEKSWQDIRDDKI